MLRLSAFLAIRQLRHQGPSFIGGLAGVCVAVVLMFMQLGFRNALYDSAVHIPQVLDADIFITAPQYQALTFSPPWLARQTLMESGSIHGVATARPLYAFSGQMRSPRDGGNMSGWILAFDLDRPVFTLPGINENLNLLRLPYSGLLDSKSRYDYTLLRDALRGGAEPKVSLYQPGSSLSPVITLSGLFTLGPSFTIDGLIVTSELNFYRLLNIPLDRVSVGLIKVEPDADPTAVKAALSHALDGRAKVMLRDEYIATEKRFYATRTPIGIIFNIGLFVGVIVGIVFIAQVLHGLIDANLREYAVLATMGYKNAFFMAIVFEIATAIAVLTFLPSAIISSILYWLAGAATQLPLVLRLESVLAILGLVLMMGNLAAMIAMRKLKLANPLDLFS